MTATATRIADLLATQRIKGEVTVIGRITNVDLRANSARRPWATVQLTDDGLNVIDVKILPDAYATLTAHPTPGDTVTVTGWLGQPNDDQPVVIYGEQIVRAPQ